MDSRTATVTVTAGSMIETLSLTQSGVGIYAIHFVDIPAGSFMMGGLPGEEYMRDNVRPEFCFDNDLPRHKVTLIQSFQMSECEITNAQYAEFLQIHNVGEDGKMNVAGYGLQTLVTDSEEKVRFNTYITEYAPFGLTWSASENKWIPQPGYDNHPVFYVSWYGAKAFCDYYGYRLPTEAEWEYAARAGRDNDICIGVELNTYSEEVLMERLNEYAWFYPGDDPDDDIRYPKNVSTEDNPVSPHRVRQKLPNAFGLYDMTGNIGEWCSDFRQNYTADDVTDPVGEIGSGTEGLTVFRDGSVYHDIASCRISCRGGWYKDYSRPGLGFRVVK
jgi:formylglycine-generating enzyme required for sulfatase activity